MARSSSGPQVPIDDDHQPLPLWRRVLAGLLGIALHDHNDRN